jgi:hypothetical protein
MSAITPVPAPTSERCSVDGHVVDRPAAMVCEKMLRGTPVDRLTTDDAGDLVATARFVLSSPFVGIGFGRLLVWGYPAGLCSRMALGFFGPLSNLCWPSQGAVSYLGAVGARCVLTVGRPSNLGRSSSQGWFHTRARLPLVLTLAHAYFTSNRAQGVPYLIMLAAATAGVPDLEDGNGVISVSGR